MGFPKKIRILGRNYPVKVHHEKESGNDNLGSHWGKYTKIYINSQVDQQEKESCLVHEILEAINQLEDIGLKHHQIKRLETGIYQVFKENDLNFNRR